MMCAISTGVEKVVAIVVELVDSFTRLRVALLLNFI
jgi:hypothetical protein